ncbi:MAG: hypothetical protein CM15mP81_06210 [Alphaproteobacteria bacterium]|nr:MAG: hypothetical protein CM15mP81_06210 [Alphaproteobacteria bacterium]
MSAVYLTQLLVICKSSHRKIADRIVSSGGIVIMGETLEWLGVENDLAKRAVSSDVGTQIKKVF